MVTRQELRFVVFQCTFCLGLIMTPMLAALNIRKQLQEELKKNEGRWMRMLILVILDIRDQIRRKWSPCMIHGKGRSSNSTLFWRPEMERTSPGPVSLRGAYFSLLRPLVERRAGLGSHGPGDGDVPSLLHIAAHGSILWNSFHLQGSKAQVQQSARAPFRGVHFQSHRPLLFEQHSERTENLLHLDLLQCSGRLLPVLIDFKCFVPLTHLEIDHISSL